MEAGRTSEPLHVCGGEVVGESVEVQAQFPVPAVTECVELPRGRGDQGVVLTAGHGRHCEGLQAGHQLGQGGLQDLVTQAQLAVAGETETEHLRGNVREVTCEEYCSVKSVGVLEC